MFAILWGSKVFSFLEQQCSLILNKWSILMVTCVYTYVSVYISICIFCIFCITYACLPMYGQCSYLQTIHLYMKSMQSLLDFSEALWNTLFFLTKLKKKNRNSMVSFFSPMCLELNTAMRMLLIDKNSLYVSFCHLIFSITWQFIPFPLSTFSCFLCLPVLYAFTCRGYYSLYLWKLLGNLETWPG